MSKSSKVELKRAHLGKVQAETDKTRIEAERAQIHLENDRSVASRSGIYHFVGAVTEKAAKDCIDSLDTWSRRDPFLEFTIVLNTPGGDVIDGLALYDFIVSDLRGTRGHHVTTVARGYAASMGGSAPAGRRPTTDRAKRLHADSRGLTQHRTRQGQ